MPNEAVKWHNGEPYIYAWFHVDFSEVEDIRKQLHDYRKLPLKRIFERYAFFEKQFRPIYNGTIA